MPREDKGSTLGRGSEARRVPVQNMSATESIILYVDDEATNRIVFEQTFGKKFRVKAVDSGEKALAILATEPVSVLVTDQRMPTMSGRELLALAKVQSPDTVRIIVTAYSDLEPILSAVNEGLVVRYLIKPWDRAELEGILRWGLEAYDIGRQSGELQLRLVHSERLLTLGQVAAVVLHDLRQPVACLAMSGPRLQELGEVAPLLRRLAADPNLGLSATDRAALEACAREIPEIAVDMCSSAALMTGILEQMRPFQRLGPDTTSTTEGVDPTAMIQVAISMCREGAANAGCSVVYDGPEKLPRVRASSSAILQILINVIRNAEQAIEEGAKGGSVVVRASEKDGMVRFAVVDDGPGISPEVLGRLGTPFFTSRAEGTGLGIAQCKRLVGGLGGEFRIESTVGRGTTVSFTLPVLTTG